MLGHTVMFKDIHIPFMEMDVPNDVNFCIGLIPEATYTGIVFNDLHIGDDCKYKLFNGSNPIGYTLYEYIKNKLPEKYHWKLAGSLAAHNRFDLLPPKVLYNNIELLDETVTTYQRYKQKEILTYSFPIIRRLAKPITCLCAMGEGKAAYKLVLESERPDDIVYSRIGTGAIKSVESEKRNVIENSNALSFGRILYYKIKSEYKIQNIIAPELAQSTNKIVAMYNEELGLLYIYGLLTGYIVPKISKIFGRNLGYNNYSATIYIETEEDQEKMEQALRSVF